MRNFLPNKSSLWRWIERAANIGIVLAVGLLAWQLWYRSPSKARQGPEVVKVGDRLTLPDTAGTEASRRLLLVFRTGCHYCVESLPFYGELARMAVHDGLAFVTPIGEEAATTQAVHGARIESVPVYAADFAKNRFFATPLVLSVDAQRQVLAVWRGKLSPSEQAEVRKALTALTPGS